MISLENVYGEKLCCPVRISHKLPSRFRYQQRTSNPKSMSCYFLLFSSFDAHDDSFYMKRICENFASQLSLCRMKLRSLCDDRLYTDVSLSIHRLDAELYEFLTTIKGKKITNLANGKSRKSPAQRTVEAVITNNAQDTRKLVVTIPEDLPLGDDESA